MYNPYFRMRWKSPKSLVPSALPAAVSLPGGALRPRAFLLLVNRPSPNTRKNGAI